MSSLGSQLNTESFHYQEQEEVQEEGNETRRSGVREDPVDEALRMFGYNPDDPMWKSTASKPFLSSSSTSQDPLSWLKVSSKHPHLRKALRLKLIELYSENGRLSKLEEKVNMSETLYRTNDGIIGEEFFGLKDGEEDAKGTTFNKKVKRFSNDKALIERAIMVNGSLT